MSNTISRIKVSPIAMRIYVYGEDVISKGDRLLFADKLSESMYEFDR
jgi:hypothetical protein